MLKSNKRYPHYKIIKSCIEGKHYSFFPLIWSYETIKNMDP